MGANLNTCNMAMITKKQSKGNRKVYLYMHYTYKNNTMDDECTKNSR